MGLQAYGSKQYRVVGVVLQRALLICLTAFAAVQLLWTQLPTLLLLAGDCPVSIRFLAQSACVSGVNGEW
jgi:hypothetical protein